MQHPTFSLKIHSTAFNEDTMVFQEVAWGTGAGNMIVLKKLQLAHAVILSKHVIKHVSYI